MDDDQSINDILDAGDDDHENWSDFSIEEELPSNYREEERNNNKSKLCQVEKSKATAAQATLETIEMETENIVKSILEDILYQVFDSEIQESGEISGVQDEKILPEIAQETCHCPKDNLEAFENEVNNDLNNNLIIEDFANALASEVIHEMLNDAKDLQEMEDEDEFFLVLHPPTHESEIDHDDQNYEDIEPHSDDAHYDHDPDQDPEQEMDQDLEHRLAMLENQVVSLQECVEESEVNAESAQMELVKEKAKVESLQYELNEQIRLFALKFEQEHEDYEELKTDFKKLQEDRQKDRESFQKTTQSLQKSVLEKTNLLKEKEESNSILRKEAMDLVTRFSHEHDEMDQKLDLTRREMLIMKKQNGEKDQKLTNLEEKLEDAIGSLDQKKYENKKLSKEVKKLKRLIDEEKNKSTRNQRFNRILDHIENID